MAVERVWDTTAADSTLEELAYFFSLKFAVLIFMCRINAFPLQHMLDWLLNPRGPPLCEGSERNVQGNVPCRAFVLLAVPKFLYGPGGMPFFLNQCVRIILKPLEEERVVFSHSSPESNAIPFLQPCPLCLDFATKDLIKEAPMQAPLQLFSSLPPP